MKKNLFRPDNISLIDNLKAVAIVFCVFHLPSESLFPWVLMLKEVVGVAAVPLFCLLSAYYMKADMERASTVFVEKITAMLIWVSGLYFVLGLALNLSGLLVDRVKLYSSAGQFYLILLILWKVSMPYVLRLRALIMWIVVAALFLGPSLLPQEKAIPSIVWAFGFYTPFFLVGLLLTWDKIILFRDSPKKHYCLIVVAPVLIYNVIASLGSGEGLGLTAPTQSAFVQRLVTSFAVIILAFGYMTGRKVKILLRIGSNSLLLYLFHTIFITWIYGLYVYPVWVAPNVSPIIAHIITLVVVGIVLAALSVPGLLRGFFTITEITRRSIFKP